MSEENQVTIQLNKDDAAFVLREVHSDMQGTHFKPEFFLPKEHTNENAQVPAGIVVMLSCIIRCMNDRAFFEQMHEWFSSQQTQDDAPAADVNDK